MESKRCLFIACVALLFLNLLPWQLAHAALVTVEVDGNNASLSGSQASIFAGFNQLQVSYSYYSQSDCSSPCIDALIDLQVHLSNATGDKSYHWNLGNFVHKGGQSSGQLLLVGDAMQLDSSETIAGDSLSGAAATTIAPASLRLTLSGIVNPSATLPPLAAPAATHAQVCIGDTADPCAAGTANLIVDFTPQFFQPRLAFQWANPLPQGNKVTRLYWNEARKQYLAVGHNGTIMSSSNGIAWAQQGRISTQYEHDPDSGNRIEVSPPYAMLDDINALSFANDRYVIVGRKFIAVSRFGIDWVYHFRPRDNFLDVNWDSITNARFMAVGNWINNQSNIVVSDATASTWPTMYQTPMNTRLRKLIAGGDSRYYAINSGDGSILYAGSLNNGGVWLNGNGSARFNDIVWDANGNIAIAVGEKNALYYGNVASWSPFSVSMAPNAVFHGIAPLGPGHYLASGFSTSCSNLAELSLPDSVTIHNWLNPCATPNTPVIFQLAFNGQHYIASSEDRKLYQLNAGQLGNDWTAISRGQENDVHAIAYAEGEQRFYAVGQQAYFANSSDDGANWTPIALATPSSASLFAVAADTATTPVVVAVGQAGSIVRYDTSVPATADVLSQGSATLRDITWVGDKFIAVGDNNSVFSSLDGQTWSDEFGIIAANANLGSEAFDFVDVFNHDNLVFILGNNRLASATQKTVLLQLDTSSGTWQANASPLFASSNEIFAMAYSGNTYVVSASGDNQDLLLSNDGINWMRHSSVSANDSPMSSVIWSGEGFVGIGPLKNTAGGFVYPSWFQSRDGYDWQKTRAPLNFNASTRRYPLAMSNTAVVTGGGFGSLLYALKAHDRAHRAAKISLPSSMTGQSGTSLTIDASETDPANIATRSWRFMPDLSDPVNVNVQSSSASLTFVLPEVPANLRPNDAIMVLRYSVTDQQGVLSSAQLPVTVTPSNQAPVVDSLNAANGLNVVEGELINLVAAVSDPDGDPISSKTWSVLSAPSLDLSACDNQTSCQFSAPAVASATDLVVRYQVADIFNAPGERTISLHISPNQAPQISMPAAISVSEGETLVLDGVRVSDDGPSDKLTYLWQVDSASAFMPSTASIVNPQQLKALLVAPRLPDNTAQVLTLRLSVSDHLNKSSSATLLVTVQAATAADAARIPQANAGPDLPSAGQLLAGSKIVLDAGATVDTQQQFDYEWYYSGAFDANQNPIAMPSIDLLADIGNIQRASFIAPLASAEYFLVFNLRVSDNTATPSLSSVDTLVLHISVTTPLIDGVDASISVNNTPLNSSIVTVIAGEPLHLQASNAHFVSGQQTVDVGTQDAAQYLYHWQSNDYPYFAFDAVNQAQVDFPPIATVSASSYQFVLQMCDHYMLICTSKAFYLSVDQAGGFAGADQIIEKPGRIVELQFTDNGRKTLDNNKADNRYETLHWQQISPQTPQLRLSGANSALATFNTAGVKKGDYVFQATYQVLDANDQPLADALSDEVVISFVNDVPAFKATPPQSKGGALDIYFSLFILLLLLSRYPISLCRACSRMRAALL